MLNFVASCCISLHHVAFCCILLHSILSRPVAFRCIPFCCILLHFVASCCTLLHSLPVTRPALNSQSTSLMPPLPSSALVPASDRPTQQQLAAIHHTYQSLRTLTPYEHPAPSRSQPFMGYESLGVNMTSHVNQQHLISASNHRSMQPRLPTRGCRRGPALQSPTLPRSVRVKDCMSADLLQVKVKVYPPQVSSYYCNVYRWYF